MDNLPYLCRPQAEFQSSQTPYGHPALKPKFPVSSSPSLSRRWSSESWSWITYSPLQVWHDVPWSCPQWQSPHVPRAALCFIATPCYEVPKTGTVIHHSKALCSSESFKILSGPGALIYGDFFLFLNTSGSYKCLCAVCSAKRVLFGHLITFSSSFDLSSEVTWTIDSWCSIWRI